MAELKYSQSREINDDKKVKFDEEEVNKLTVNSVLSNIETAKKSSKERRFRKLSTRNSNPNLIISKKNQAVFNEIKKKY